MNYILLVEDDPNDVELILHVFRSNKLANRIEVARDGAEALELVYAEDDDGRMRLPGCILLDLKLPKIDGLEVLRQIKEDRRTKRVPVVILTSSREVPDLHRAYELGANSFLCKPMDFNAFVDVVKQIGLYWLLLNEVPPA